MVTLHASYVPCFTIGNSAHTITRILIVLFHYSLLLRKESFLFNRIHMARQTTLLWHTHIQLYIHTSHMTRLYYLSVILTLTKRER